MLKTQYAVQMQDLEIVVVLCLGSKTVEAPDAEDVSTSCLQAATSVSTFPPQIHMRHSGIARRLASHNQINFVSYSTNKKRASRQPVFVTVKAEAYQ